MSHVKFFDMVERLKIVRSELSKRQDSKLWKRWEEKGDYRKFNAGKLAESCVRELNELIEAISKKGPDAIEDEILDVRNMTEFLFDVLIFDHLY